MGGWEERWVWMGVGCPCPPVRNDIVTPRHLFYYFGLYGCFYIIASAHQHVTWEAVYPALKLPLPNRTQLG